MSTVATSLVLLFAPGDRPAIGERVGACEFVDVRFQRRSLDDFGPRDATVLYFTRVECPLAPKYLPRLVALEHELRSAGGGAAVQFVGVDVGHEDLVADVATQALDHGVDFPFVRDCDLSTAKACGATRAGEVVVLDRERRLRYRGRVDGTFRVGGESSAESRADLALALDEVVHDRAVTLPETRAEGCPIDPTPAPRPGVTYAKDVGPVVRARCATCHQPGGAAPFALLDAVDVRDHAAGIAEVVETGRMPPWHVSREHGTFVSPLRLPKDERALLLDWARGGAAIGDLDHAAPLPPPAKLVNELGWRIGTPDLVLAAPEQSIPADGIVPYRYAVLPKIFFEETWVEAVEIRPKNARVMHHCNLAHVTLGEQFRTENFVTGQVPGGSPLELDPGSALKIPAGSVLGLQIHYVTSGKEERDQIEVALRFPKTTVQRQLHHLECADLRFAIPPGANAHPVSASRTLECDAVGLGLYAHMHKRGSDMRFSATRPGAASETLLLVPDYDFDWQAGYRFPRDAVTWPKGTRIDCLAHFDNSPFNPFNPDPKATVRFGLQTEQEMMYGFVFYFDAHERLGMTVDPRNGHVVNP
jgi:hypothetical protein